MTDSDFLFQLAQTLIYKYNESGDSEQVKQLLHIARNMEWIEQHWNEFESHISTTNAKLANVHEKLLAIDYELEAINPMYREMYKEAPLQFARTLVKEALDITQVKEKQCKKQAK